MSIFKQFSEYDALNRMAKLCAKREYSRGEIKDKLSCLGVSTDKQEHIISKLISLNYINDERYASMFIADKIKFNKWGPIKIEQGLLAKHVPESIYKPLLKEIDDGVFLNVLIPLLKKKYTTINAKNKYEKKQKLFRYGLSRGFNYNILNKVFSYLNFTDE